MEDGGMRVSGSTSLRRQRPAADNMESNVVLVDGECVLCDSFARFVAERDSKGLFVFETQQSNAGQQLLQLYNLPLDLKTIVLIDASTKIETCHIKSSAVLRIVSQLACPWVLASCCFVIPAAVRDWMYTCVAERRYAWFGKKAECRLPDEAVRERLLRRLHD